MSANTVVRTNMLSINAHRNLGLVANQQSRASQRLSSGFRINSASDDAAGLAISETMRAQIRGLDQASRNAQDGISLIQTAEGGLAVIGDMVNRIRELVVQASNDTYTSDDRALIQLEIDQLIEEIEATAQRIEFNTMALLDGEGLTELHLQIGANDGNGLLVEWDGFADILEDVHVALGEIGDLDELADQDGADIAAMLEGIDAVLTSVNEARANMGALINRLEFTIENLDMTSENLSASESRIRDADMAREMMSLTQANVLQQAAISMLAQANQAPQSVLQLLG